jgi:hypothetical protein
MDAAGTIDFLLQQPETTGTSSSVELAESQAEAVIGGIRADFSMVRPCCVSFGGYPLIRLSGDEVKSGGASIFHFLNGNHDGSI